MPEDPRPFLCPDCGRVWDRSTEGQLAYLDARVFQVGHGDRLRACLVVQCDDCAGMTGQRRPPARAEPRDDRPGDSSEAG
ncbi:MAG: hypothetical protein HYU41_00880 [Candidatus Rokubacteria bacterium]|nr:hypothetical protein [Candidatus Rokubacteria bacterium]